MAEKRIDYKLIGARIRAARKEQNVTQQALSDACELSMNHISHIETGASALSLPALLAICKALQCTADRLLYDNLPVTSQAQLHYEISKCFHGTTQAESYVMLEVARAARYAMKASESLNKDD